MIAQETIQWWPLTSHFGFLVVVVTKECWGVLRRVCWCCWWEKERKVSRLYTVKRVVLKKNCHPLHCFLWRGRRRNAEKNRRTVSSGTATAAAKDVTASRTHSLSSEERREEKRALTTLSLVRVSLYSADYACRRLSTGQSVSQWVSKTLAETHVLHCTRENEAGKAKKMAINLDGKYLTRRHHQ